MNIETHQLTHKTGISSLLLSLYRRLADTRIVVPALLSTIALGSIMAYEVDGSMLTAFQTSFTPDNARNIMREWGMENIAHFRRVFWLDDFFPAVQAIFLSSLIARLTVKRGDPGKILLALFLTPFLAAACDYMENYFYLTCSIILIHCRVKSFLRSPSPQQQKWYLLRSQCWESLLLL